VSSRRFGEAARRVLDLEPDIKSSSGGRMLLIQEKSSNNRIICELGLEKV
jgi:hypothetical protein